MASAHRLRLSSPPVIRGSYSPSPRFLGKNLLSFGEIPKWHRDNELIRYGYRSISGSAQVSFRSWLYIYNESVNIYSYLIPAIIFLFSKWYIKEYFITKHSNIIYILLLICIYFNFIILLIYCYYLPRTFNNILYLNKPLL